MKAQSQTRTPLPPGSSVDLSGEAPPASLPVDSIEDPQKLLLSREMCEVTANTYFAHFTSKLIHSQANAVGVRVAPAYGKDIPYLCGARMLNDGIGLGLDYIAQFNEAGGQKDNSRNPHLLRVLELRRRSLLGKDAKPHPKDDCSEADLYANIAQGLPEGEIGDGLCPRCKQIILPVVENEDDWEEFNAIKHIAVTPLSSGWINSYFFERFFERSAEIKDLKGRLEALIKDLKKAKDDSERESLKEQVADVSSALTPHMRFRDIMSVTWPVGGGNMQNVTGYYQRMMFSLPPEVSRADRVFFSILYGNRVYGEWDERDVVAFLEWERANPSTSRGDSLFLDEEIVKFFLPSVRKACFKALGDHHQCTQSTAYQKYYSDYVNGSLPDGVTEFSSSLVFGDFSHDFCLGLANQLVNSIEPRLQKEVGLSEGFRVKLTSLFLGVIEEFF